MKNVTVQKIVDLITEFEKVHGKVYSVAYNLHEPDEYRVSAQQTGEVCACGFGATVTEALDNLLYQRQKKIHERREKLRRELHLLEREAV